MKTVAFVPIKLNNERLPNKNILPLGDKPLCQHLLYTLTKVSLLDEIYVFCSQPQIKEYLPIGVKFLEREPELDTFTTRHYDIVKSFVSKVNADVYVNAHVTNPFIKPQTIESGIKSILYEGHDCAVAVTEIREHLWQEKKPFNFMKNDPPRTQDLIPFFAEVGVFMYKKEIFSKTGTRYGKNPYFMVLDKIEAVDINQRDDYELAQAVWIVRNSKQQNRETN
jgi:CMP-N-acetylneuraminic acid synthetase